MTYYQRLLSWLPKPFKFIQKQLDIQVQWKQFKQNLKPHKYKLYILTIGVTYPLYSPYVDSYYNKVKYYMFKNTSQALQPDQPAFQIGDTLIKNLIDSILKDQNVKKEGLDFVQRIILDDRFVEQILQLLLGALKQQQFLNEVGNTSKDLIITQLKDPQISEELNIFVRKIATSKQTQQSFIQLIKEVFSSKQSVDTIVNLLSKGVSSDQVKSALSDTVNYSVKQLLADEETLNQLKIFIFFLLRKFESDDEIKSMMDILFAKGLGLVKKTGRKNVQLEKILKIGKSGVNGSKLHSQDFA